MHTALKVLRDFNLFQIIVHFQFGLPKELVEICCLAESIEIIPNYTDSSRTPTAYLSNIPPRFSNTSYIKQCNQVPNTNLFLKDHFKEPTLPLHLSIVENNGNHVELWIKNKPEWLSTAPLKLAAICGHLGIVQRLINASKNVWTPEAMDLAAMNGYLDIVIWLHNLENGPGCTIKAMDGAATYGHLQVVEFLNENRSEGCTFTALKMGASNGYSKVVEYLLTHLPKQHIDEGFTFFGYYGILTHQAVEEKDYIGVIQSLQSHSLSVSDIHENIIYAAVKENPLEYISRYNIYGITKKIFDEVIESGDQVAIRCAVEAIFQENDKPISLIHDEVVLDPWTPIDTEFALRSPWAQSSWKHSRAMDIAAALGNMEAIQLLHQTGIQCCSVAAISMASLIGRIDIVEWLYSNRNEGWSDTAMTFAATNGHLDMVKWLHGVAGLNCTEDGLASAAINGDIAMVSYLISIPMSDKAINVMDARRWLLSGLNKYLCPSNNRFRFLGLRSSPVDQAASNGHIEIVNLLHNFDATTNAMDEAVSNGHFDMVKYLHTSRKEGCTTHAIMNAVLVNRLDILKYLVENNCCHGVIKYEKVCLEATGCDNIEMLKFCMDQLQNDLQQSSKQCMMLKAATRGLLNNVKWLHESKGFGWTLLIRDNAEKRGRKRIVHYFDIIDKPEANALSEWDILQTNE
ncbi:hypothetical protein THRCLA_06783 [Thraustotheca clavata]|uniref:Uncharacterized protein n=1 Tax=Thraustotheca clavata TaxID=74557 RepID=A0A1V9ZK09_9STRA|nr:hypothetical protein THRCLA_06783 [Thraustotheca clavata]